MNTRGRKTGTFKTELERSRSINLRISDVELEMIDRLCAQRKADGSKLNSRSDVIMLAIKFSLGELSLLDRMELNLMEGKSLFDIANMPVSKYTRKFREDMLTNRPTNVKLNES